MAQGRPSKYSSYYAPLMAEVLASAGMLDKDIADRMGIAESTLNRWKLEHPEFREAIDRGKEEPNLMVEAAILKSALGHKEDEVTQHRDEDGNIVGTTMVRRYYPPNTGAMIFFLKNRIPERWRDRQEVALSAEEEPLAKFATSLREFRLVTEDAGK